jgi:hypothetical protein
MPSPVRSLYLAVTDAEGGTAVVRVKSILVILFIALALLVPTLSGCGSKGGAGEEGQSGDVPPPEQQALGKNLIDQVPKGE